MRHILLTAICACSLFAQTPVPVPTYHNNNSRTGLNNGETTLTWNNVNVNSFRLLFTYPVDAQVYAQPLYVPGLNINGVTHNVVFAATENNSVYAFDADSNAGANGGLLWHVSFNVGPAGVTVTPVASSDIGCSDISPIYGITGTPVIDIASQTLYVVAKTKEVSQSGVTYAQRLHALSLTDGQEKFGGPGGIQGSVPGACGNADGHGNIIVDPLLQNQRAGLLLSSGTLYVAFASHCDINPYNGWMLAYSPTTLQQTGILSTSPDGTNRDCRGGIWQAGAGPATDAAGNIYFLTGNGTFNAANGGHSYGDSFVKLNPAPALTVNDYFTPVNQSNMDSADLDLGAGGALVLPDQTGPNPHLVVGTGKTGTIYLVNRDNMGKSGIGGAVQQIPGAVGSRFEPFPMPAYVNQAVYFAGANDNVKGFQLNNGKLTPRPFATSAQGVGFEGAGLSTSSDPSGNNAIVWALDGNGSPAIVHAYKATDLTELYNSNQAGTRDNPGPGVKFSVPTVSGGKVYVGTANTLAVYGNF
ncbi:MAG: pyrrolo-quinoline quinone [Terriglobia bacterium]|nr:MAG: pyrrolo-quinoline quinone [Terriglobia bacterium]